MKINVSNPSTGQQKLFDIEDELKVRPFYDKRISAECSADSLGDEWKGYIVKIRGGNDKQGFPMKNGVLTNGRARLLLSSGSSCYRPRRTGERRRKSVRGCIVDGNLSVLNLVIVKKGNNDIPGLTDSTLPRRLGPKRVGKIRKLFNLQKEDDVRQYVVRRTLTTTKSKPKIKAPKVQRLITPIRLQRRRAKLAEKKKRGEKARSESREYAKMRRMLKAAKRRRSSSKKSLSTSSQ